MDLACILYSIYDREAKLEAIEQANQLTVKKLRADILPSSGDASKGANLFKVRCTMHMSFSGDAN
jgi:hypothetical protein